MDDNITGAADKFARSLERIDKLLSDITQKLKTVGEAGSSGMSNNGFGGKNIGVGSTSMMPAGSLGAISSLVNSNRKMNLWGGIAQGAIKVGGGILGGAAMMAPDVSLTMARAGGFYQSGVMSGIGWRGISLGTFSQMAGGITSVGSDAATAAILTGMGISPGTGQYRNTIANVVGAAKYLNMPNEQAAKAIGGLTSGSSSASLMRNYGIFTTNPVTGQRMKPGQIFEQIFQRLTLGRKVTREGLLSDYQAGIMKENLAATGLDGDQQALAFQYMLDRASGKYDPSKTSKDYLEAMGSSPMSKDNPLSYQYQINTAATGTMQTATDAYVQGTKDAAAAITEFQHTIQRFIRAFPQFAQGNAMVQTAMGDNSVSGAVAGAGQIFSGLGQIGSSVITDVISGKVLKSIGLDGSGGAPVATGGRYRDPKTGRFAKAPKISAGRGRISGAGKLGAGASAALGGIQLGMDAINGQGWGTKQFSADLGATAGGVIGALAGSLLDPFLGPMGTIGGSMVGSYLGSQIGGMFGQGGTTSTVGTGSTTGVGQGKWMVYPVGNVRISSDFGVRDNAHPNPHHGVDWPVGVGTSVKAAAAGKVTMRTQQGSYGNVLEIDHGGGYKTRYAHLSAFQVAMGATVQQGQVVAKSGGKKGAAGAGNSTGPHLHFELWKNGTRIDPKPGLGATASSANVSNTLTGGAQASKVVSYTSAAGGSASVDGYMGSTGGNIATPAAYSGASAASATYTAHPGGIGVGVSTPTNPSERNGRGGPDSEIGTKNNVTINLTISDASDEEARRFAARVKDYLDNSKMLASMGGM